MSDARHKAAIERALTSVEEALGAARDGLPIELAAVDLRAAAAALGEITGETASEDLLDTIFGRFCIGK